jgi:hypothetical protein
LKRDCNHIIRENKKRLADLFQEYDPVFGIGSPIPRFPFHFTGKQKRPILLPETMRKDPEIKNVLESGCRSAEEYAVKNGMDSDKFLELLTKIRFQYDFEFFAYTSIKVEDKISKQPVPFRLRKPQRKLLKQIEADRWAGIPIRVNLVKARQWGGSTFVQCYFFWMQTAVKENWHSAVVAHLDDAAKNIRGMYGFIAKNYPKDLGNITLKPHEGSSKNKKVQETGSIIGVGSSQTPDNLRGYSFAMLHMSELAFYVSTQNKTAKDLAQSLSSTVPLSPDTIIIRESTAKGVGNYWHQVCVSSQTGKSRYRIVFVAFYEIEIYHMEISNYQDFINSMSEYEWELWDLGASLESIKWYREFKETEGYDDWRMKSEYPSTVLEAFQATGNRVFPQKYVHQARKANMDPVFIGEIYGDADSGKEALNNIRFEKQNNGRLHVWSMPEPDTEKTKILNRYCVAMDIGGRSEGADYSVIRVMDRFWLSENGIPEMVATWKGHIDQDLLAWKAIQISKAYNNALFIPESNSLRTKTEETEGDHFLTVLDEIIDHYENIYCRTKPEQIREGLPRQYGFHTNRQTKQMIINNLRAAIRDTQYFETDHRACDEMDQYENKQDGTLGAVDGAHDDILMCTAILVWASLKYMEPVQVIEIGEAPIRMRKPVNEASF